MQKNKELTEEEKIREARNAYHREYRKKNRKKIAEQKKRWREQNPERVKEHNRNYWLRKAEELQAK